MRRGTLIGVVAVAGFFALIGSGTGATSPRYPRMYVTASSSSLRAATSLEFELGELDAAAATERVEITTPRGYGSSVTRAPGSILGTSFLDVGRSAASATRYRGNLTVMAQRAYANDATAQSCAPGAHTAVWKLTVKASAKELAVPVAVDRVGPGYKLTMCFDGLLPRGMQAVVVDFKLDDVFRNPAIHGNYEFKAIVTPLAAGGGPATQQSYELRGFENLPETITAVATYSAATKLLTVHGTAIANGKGRFVYVEIYAGQSDNYRKLIKVGQDPTNRSGAYTFTKRLARAPKYAYTLLYGYPYRGCLRASSTPGGCASYTIDGAASTYMTVEQL